MESGLIMKVDFEWDLIVILQVVISAILPLIVGLVTSRVTRSGLKALLLAGLAFLTSFVAELLTAITARIAFDFGTWLVGAIGSFALAVSTHYGFWRPVGATGFVQAHGVKAPVPPSTPPPTTPPPSPPPPTEPPRVA
jgi:hypothetical protein